MIAEHMTNMAKVVGFHKIEESNTRKLPGLHTHMHTHTYTHTYTYTHIHTHAHTYTHTYTYTHPNWQRWSY